MLEKKIQKEFSELLKALNILEQQYKKDLNDNNDIIKTFNTLIKNKKMLSSKILQDNIDNDFIYIGEFAWGSVYESIITDNIKLHKIKNYTNRYVYLYKLIIGDKYTVYQIEI